MIVLCRLYCTFTIFPSALFLQGTAGDLTYTIEKNSNIPGNSYQFFYVNPSTGDLSVTRELTSDVANLEYKVRED